MTAEVIKERTNEEWLRDLRDTGPLHDDAVARLREYLLRAVLVYLTRHRSDLAGLDFEELQQLAEDWAQSAVLQILDKLDTFRGASKFTTWAYRVAINLAAADLRRKRWDDLSVESLVDERETPFDLTDEGRAGHPQASVEQVEIWATVTQVIRDELTERQRTALTRAVLDGAPMDVVAEELATNRNNVYKILHDARKKLRRAMEERGWGAQDVFDAFEMSRAD